MLEKKGKTHAGTRRTAQERIATVPEDVTHHRHSGAQRICKPKHTAPHQALPAKAPPGHTENAPGTANTGDPTMPRLNEYISVGFCNGYGDGDYRVSCAVEDLSRKQLDELMLAMFHAQRTAWDMWCRAQHQETPEQANTGDHP